ncbi:hypothetical protein NQ318_002996, partial [Aromia moschata]
MEKLSLALLQNNVGADLELEVPTMANLYPAEGNPQLPGNAIWFQQDDAPAHYEVDVRQYLHTIFPNRWIGRRGSVQSPDLTPMVYKTKPDDLADLRRRITLAIRSITPQMLTNVRRHFYLRLGCCQDAGDMHFVFYFN